MVRVFIFLALFLLLFQTVLYQPVFVYAQTTGSSSQSSSEIDALNQKIADRKAKIKDLEETMAQVQKDIDKKRLESVSLKNQTAILDNHIKQVELDVETTKQKIDELSIEIEVLDIDIKSKEETIFKQKKIIAELVRSLYYADGKNVIEILAAYNSFSDFYDNIQYLQTIETSLAQTVKTIRLAKESLNEKHTLRSQEKNSYVKLQSDLKNKEQNLNEERYSKQTLLAQTQSSELNYRTLLASMKKQAASVENEISSIEQEVRKKLEDQNKLKGSLEPQFNGVLSWPVQSHYIAAFFHDPDYPFRNVMEHSGIDIRASYGTAVHAAASGYVARAKRCAVWTCYSYIMLVHSGGISTVYGHLSAISVADDQFISRDDIIGYSGGTPHTVGAGPFVTGPHLHFEVRKDGIPVNAISYFSASDVIQ